MYNSLANLYLPPLIFMIGLVGASVGLIVFSKRKKLKRIGPINTYKYLLITDNFYLFQVFLFYSASNLNIKIYLFSRELCKLLSYIRFLATPLSPMLLIYISMERYLSIKYPRMKFTLRRNSIQFTYFSMITIYNMIFYIPILFIFDIDIVSNKTKLNETYYCLNKSPILTYYMDLFNRVLIPFVFMCVSSFLLIESIFKSRRKVIAKYTTKELNKIKKDVSFAVSSISLNVFYLGLNLPFSIIALMYDFNIWAHNLLNLNFALSFYILFTNTLFRSEFIHMIKSIFRSTRPLSSELKTLRSNQTKN